VDEGNMMLYTRMVQAGTILWLNSGRHHIEFVNQTSLPVNLFEIQVAANTSLFLPLVTTP
jgi:hypothetical protein